MASSTNIGEATVASYAIDPARSRFQVRASATGLLAAFGHNPTIAIRNFKGEAWYRPQAPEQSSLRVEIDPASLAVTGDVNEKDRAEMDRAMREDVLETANYPDILFESTGIQADRIAEGMYRARISGKLTLHGVTRDLEFFSTATVSDDNLRANGEFSIRQTDYRIKLVSVAGGTLKLKDELKFTFDVAAHRRTEAA